MCFSHEITEKCEKTQSTFKKLFPNLVLDKMPIMFPYNDIYDEFWFLKNMDKE